MKYEADSKKAATLVAAFLKVSELDAGRGASRKYFESYFKVR